VDKNKYHRGFICSVSGRNYSFNVPKGLFITKYNIY